MSRVKILYQSSIPHIKMGGQKSLLALIDNLDYEKYEPEVIIPLSGPLGDALTKRGIKTHIMRVPAFKPKNAFKILRTYFKLKRLIGKNGYRIIHSDHDKFMIIISFVTKKAKTIFHARVVHSHKYDKYLKNRLDAIIGISDGVLQRFEKQKNAKKFHKIYNGVDCDLFSPVEDRAAQKKQLGLETEKIAVLFVGQMKEGKGIFDLAKVAELLKDENIVFIFIGDFLDEETQEKWSRLVESNDMKNINWLGQKSDIHRWMQASDLLVLPSHEGVEGMGRVIFEAMACGTPVVASDTSGVREAITPETGILFPEKSPIDISNAILDLQKNKEKWEQFSIDARKRATTVFDIKIHAENVMNLYAELLNE